MNDLFGSIPTEIGDLTNLKELNVFGNFFLRRVPKEISNLKKLGTVIILAFDMICVSSLSLSLVGIVCGLVVKWYCVESIPIILPERWLARLAS